MSADANAGLMENYTAYLENTDVEIGRVVDAVAASGELANTLIIYIVGDNGASTEGGLKEPSTKPHSSTGSGPRVGARQDASHKTRHTVTAAVRDTEQSIATPWLLTQEPST